jgi:hypothetical protein
VPILLQIRHRHPKKERSLQLPKKELPILQVYTFALIFPNLEKTKFVTNFFTAPKPELKKRSSLEELRAKAEAERAQHQQPRLGGGGMPGDPTAPSEYGPEEIQILFNYVNNTLASTSSHYA